MRGEMRLWLCPSASLPVPQKGHPLVQPREPPGSLSGPSGKPLLGLQWDLSHSVNTTAGKVEAKCREQGASDPGDRTRPWGSSLEPTSRTQCPILTESPILRAWKGFVKHTIFSPTNPSSLSVVADNGNNHWAKESSASHLQKVHHEKSRGGQ